jgi:hypothetical protein
MKIHVIRIKKNRDTGEETEAIGEFYSNNVACLYRNNGNTSIHFKDGTFMIVKHTLEEIDSIIIRDRV